MSAESTKAKGSSDEAIGRPKEWKEGRYQQAGKPVDETVTSEPEAEPPSPPSAPVTRADYEEVGPPPAGDVGSTGSKSKSKP